MSELQRLQRARWGQAVVNGMTFIVVAMGAVISIAVLRAAATESPLVLGVLPITALIAAGAIGLQRIGLFSSPQGIVVRSFLKKLVLSWDQLQEIRVEEVTRGFLPQRTVVLVTRTGEVHPLYLWNARSLLMLGSPDGVDGLARDLQSVLDEHRGSP